MLNWTSGVKWGSIESLRVSSLRWGTNFTVFTPRTLDIITGNMILGYTFLINISLSAVTVCIYSNTVVSCAAVVVVVLVCYIHSQKKKTQKGYLPLSRVLYHRALHLQIPDYCVLASFGVWRNVLKVNSFLRIKHAHYRYERWTKWQRKVSFLFLTV